MITRTPLSLNTIRYTDLLHNLTTWHITSILHLTISQCSVLVLRVSVCLSLEGLG